MTESERIAGIGEQAEAAVEDYRNHFEPMEAALDAALHSLGLDERTAFSPAKTDAVIAAMKAYRRAGGPQR